MNTPSDGNGVFFTLLAEDTQKVASFYCETLGLFERESIHEYGDKIFEINLKSVADSRFGLLISPGSAAQLDSFLRELAIMVLKVKSWESIEKRLAAEGHTATEVVELPYGIQAHVHDPAGNHLVIFEDWQDRSP